LGERRPVFGDLAQTHVHRLNGVGGVNDPANVRREVKEGDDTHGFLIKT